MGAPPLVTDTRQAECICESCGLVHSCSYEQDPHLNHISGTLETNSGPTKYQRHKHLMKWLQDIKLPWAPGDRMHPTQRIQLFFKAIERVFVRKDIRGERKHFLSYPFVIKKMIRHLYPAAMATEVEAVCNFREMKSKARRNNHELIWAKIEKASNGFPNFTHPLRANYDLVAMKPTEPKKTYLRPLATRHSLQIKSQ